MNLIMRAHTVKENLDRYDAAEFCPWPIGRAYNLLLEEAKESFPNDRYVQMMDPLQPTEDNLSMLPGDQTADCGSVRTMVMQIQDAARAGRTR
jgi:hypothetical protein